MKVGKRPPRLALSCAGGADHVNHQMGVMREESFGPVVGIMKVRTTTRPCADERQSLWTDRLDLDA